MTEKRSVYHFPFDDLFSVGFIILTNNYEVLGEVINLEYFHRFIFRQIKGIAFIDRPKVIHRELPDSRHIFILQRRFLQSRIGLHPTESEELLKRHGYGQP